MIFRSLPFVVGALLFSLCTRAQETTDNLINSVYGEEVERPGSFTFDHVIHYSLVQRVDAGEGRPPKKLEGGMDLYFTPGDSAYGRVVTTDQATLTTIGDLVSGMRFSLSDFGETKVGAEAKLIPTENDTLFVSRVSGDREIQGRMSAHYWHEEGTTINELWADSQASERTRCPLEGCGPVLKPAFTGLAIGTYVGLATRWVSIDTEFSREPRTVSGVQRHRKPWRRPQEVSLSGFVFPVTEADMMRQPARGRDGIDQRCPKRTSVAPWPYFRGSPSRLLQCGQ